jgi:hypothetical protein
LRLIVTGQGTVAATHYFSLAMFLNTDNTATNYIVNNAEFGSGTAQQAQNNAYIGNITGTSAGATRPGMVIVDIPDYTGTTWMQVARSQSYWGSGTTGNTRSGINGYLWNVSPVAVTAIQIAAFSNSLAAGCTLDLYGIT